jgi:hypothetical protein
MIRAGDVVARSTQRNAFCVRSSPKERSAIGRLKDGWLDEHAACQKRDLSAKR